MDQLIKEALLNAIVLTVNEKDLPMENAQFWKDHIQKCAAAPINVKKSSFKNLSKFYKEMDKRGLIKYKEASKKSNNSEVTGVVRNHKDLDNFEPTINENKDDDYEEENNKKGNNKNKQKFNQDMKIEIRCEVPKLLKNLLNLNKNEKNTEELEEDKTEKKIKDFNWDIVQKEFSSHLKDKKMLNNGKVNIVKEFFEELDIVISEDEDEVTIRKEDNSENKDTTKVEQEIQYKTILLTELIEKLKEQLTFSFIVSGPDGSRQIKGQYPGIVIYMEKQHGKFITRLTGMGMLFSDVEGIGSLIETKLDVKVTVRDTKIMKIPLKEMSMPGTMLDQIMDILLMDLKVDEALIEKVDKVSKKKQKKQFVMN